jgi:hypothetical protein
MPRSFYYAGLKRRLEASKDPLVKEALAWIVKLLKKEAKSG